ncbi:hypothetical protein JYU34_011181 [Plutella xylostella]|uniref:Uncharacterized protein n=1 Tax=Plutella xylostella TaxID=51655 RepID=A0ABQ7QG85_PLUXY|nr:hypothetical protein JYU34_011181 [Plutella xylostella]
MLLLILVYLLINFTLGNPGESLKNSGTCLFKKQDINSKRCWSEKEVAILQARKIFENLTMQQISPDEIDSKYIKRTLKFFRKSLKEVDKIKNIETRDILQQSLADALGAHLRAELLPAARLAYYAGYVPYRGVRRLHDLYDEIKSRLNTQGLGWKKPDTEPRWGNLTVAKLMLGTDTVFNPCRSLIIKRDKNNCIHLPLPKLDDEESPSALALPWRAGGLARLAAARADGALLQYYVAAARCVLRRSPAPCRHDDFVSFNAALWEWLRRAVAPRLADERLYAAYGGALRVAGAARRYAGRGERGNLFEVEERASAGRPAWRALEAACPAPRAAGPALLAGCILLAAVAVAILQCCYNYMFGDAMGCHCHWPADAPPSTASMLQRQVTCARVERGGGRASSSLQRVFDLNANAERVMEVAECARAVSRGTSPPRLQARVSAHRPPPRAPPAPRAATPPALALHLVEQLVVQLELARRVVGGPRAAPAPPRPPPPRATLLRLLAAARLHQPHLAHLAQVPQLLS